MSGVYNLKSTPEAGKFIVTKFDDDLNVESSYEFHNTTDGYLCHCPAGQRPSCRHRQMFPMLQARVDSAWFLDFDTRAWIDPTGEAKAGETISYEGSIPAVPLLGPQGSLGSNLTATEVDEQIKNYSGPIPGDSIVEGFVDKLSEAVTKINDSHPFRRRM